MTQVVLAIFAGAQAMCRNRVVSKLSKLNYACIHGTKKLTNCSIELNNFSCRVQSAVVEIASNFLTQPSAF